FPSPLLPEEFGIRAPHIIGVNRRRVLRCSGAQAVDCDTADRSAQSAWGSDHSGVLKPGAGQSWCERAEVGRDKLQAGFWERAEPSCERDDGLLPDRLLFRVVNGSVDFSAPGIQHDGAQGSVAEQR